MISPTQAQLSDFIFLPPVFHLTIFILSFPFLNKTPQMVPFYFPELCLDFKSNAQKGDLKLEPHMRENIWHLSFWSWVSSLSIILCFPVIVIYLSLQFTYLYNWYSIIDKCNIFSYSFFCCWTSRLIPFLSGCENSVNEYGCACL